MARIDDCIEALAEQIILTGRWTGWKHCKNTGKRRDQGGFRHSPILQTDGNPCNTRGPRVFQGELLKGFDRQRLTKEFATTPLFAHGVSSYEPATGGAQDRRRPTLPDICRRWLKAVEAARDAMLAAVPVVSPAPAMLPTSRHRPEFTAVL